MKRIILAAMVTFSMSSAEAADIDIQQNLLMPEMYIDANAPDNFAQSSAEYLNILKMRTAEVSNPANKIADKGPGFEPAFGGYDVNNAFNIPGIDAGRFSRNANGDIMLVE